MYITGEDEKALKIKEEATDAWREVHDTYSRHQKSAGNDESRRNAKKKRD